MKAMMVMKVKVIILVDGSDDGNDAENSDGGGDGGETVVMKIVMMETSARSLTCCQFLHSKCGHRAGQEHRVLCSTPSFIAGETEAGGSKVTPPNRAVGVPPQLWLASAPPAAARLLLAAPDAPLAFPDHCSAFLTLSFLAHPEKLCVSLHHWVLIILEGPPSTSRARCLLFSQ